jgi:hypothetical protein
LLSDPERVLAVAERVRTTTLPYLRSSVGESIRALRSELSSDERTLLYLRIDCEMSWQEIAGVMDREHDSTDRAAARYRKQFERTKERLRTIAEARGLLR